MSAPNVDDIMNSNPPTIPPLAVTNLHNSGEVPGHPPNLERTASIKIINLCSELKSYDVHDDGNYVTNVVSGFNTTLLFKKLTRSSDLFDVDIDIDELCKELFRAEEWWANRDLLFNALVAFGEMKGFRVAKKHAYIKCNRYGKKEYIRNYEGGGLCVECNFIFNLKALHNPKSAPKRGGDECQSQTKIKT